MPYWEEPRYNDPEDIEGPEDVNLPSTMHHMQVKAELDLLVQEGVIDDAGAQEAMKAWRAKNELSGEDMVDAAIDVLASRDVIDEDEANNLREKAAA